MERIADTVRATEMSVKAEMDVHSIIGLFLLIKLFIKKHSLYNLLAFIFNILFYKN